VLIIDDEKPFAQMLGTMLANADYEVTTRHDAEEGLTLIADCAPDIVLCDIKMPRMNGLEFLDALGERGLSTTVITMSAFGTIDLAVEALRRGAYDYTSKPFKRDEVLLTLRKAEERQQLRSRVAELEDRVARLDALDSGERPMIGESEAIQNLKKLLVKVAAYNTTVLITGESGTGKELVAQAIHRASPRAKENIVTINCGAIPESLLESELFGHVRGAFTDAHTDKAGLFVEADGGTIFLDEVGELPPQVQVGLLRVLQEGEVRPVGATKSRLVDVRVLAATHRDLATMVEEQTFREDLLYRLNVLPIHVPALRDRPGDIALLAEFILQRVAERMSRPVMKLSSAARGLLGGYNWPGNVRELENVLERAVILSDGDKIEPHDLPPHMQTADAPAKTVLAGDDLSIKRATSYIERELIIRALEQTRGNRTRAAKLLEISPRALLYKIKDYEISL
jgi:two-component system response regulator AtoC